MDDNAILVDACILVEATSALRSKHQLARTWLSSSLGLCMSSQTIREYLVVASRPVKVNGLGLPLEVAWANVEGFLEFIRLLPEDRPVLPVFRQLTRHHKVAGKRLHDVWLVATAQVHDIKRLCTLNTEDFAGFAAELKLESL